MTEWNNKISIVVQRQPHTSMCRVSLFSNVIKYATHAPAHSTRIHSKCVQQNFPTVSNRRRCAILLPLSASLFQSLLCPPPHSRSLRVCLCSVAHPKSVTFHRRRVIFLREYGSRCRVVFSMPQHRSAQNNTT